MTYITLFEALQILPFSKPTLYRLVRRGYVRTKRVEGVRRTLYCREDLEELILDHAVEEESHRLDLSGG